jgi:hypothetical protein
MKHYNPEYPTLKEIETNLFLLLQKIFGELLKRILEDLDNQLAECRDKKRFRLKDKRDIRLDTMFGPLTFCRHYYKDRETGQYVSLLDRYLGYEGQKGFSPLLEEYAMELAVTGSSYRHAIHEIERFLGYRPMSHEALRQHLLAAEVCAPEEKQEAPEVLFVETDGLFVKQQKGKRNKRKKATEQKIAMVHMGWATDGSKRRQLVHKRHYYHEGNEPFWEGFETFLEENYNYDATKTLFVINGDAASWITACKDYFGDRAFYHLDRFRVIRDVRQLLQSHPRFKAMYQAIKENNPDRLIVELNSAVGTMATEEEEKKLEALIAFITKHKEALRDYKAWLKEKGIDTSQMYTMGASEGVMSQFADRLKQGRSWSQAGVQAMTKMIIALKDQLTVKTLVGLWETAQEQQASDRIQRSLHKRYKKQAVHLTRDNIAYLKQSSGTPIYHALKGLVGF